MGNFRKARSPVRVENGNNLSGGKLRGVDIFDKPSSKRGEVAALSVVCFLCVRCQDP